MYLSAFLSNYLYGVFSFGWPILRFISIPLSCLLILLNRSSFTAFSIVLIIAISLYLIYGLYSFFLTSMCFIGVLNQADDFIKKLYTILSGLTSIAINFCIVFFSVRLLTNG